MLTPENQKKFVQKSFASIIGKTFSQEKNLERVRGRIQDFELKHAPFPSIFYDLDNTATRRSSFRASG